MVDHDDHVTAVFGTSHGSVLNNAGEACGSFIVMVMGPWLGLCGP